VVGFTGPASGWGWTSCENGSDRSGTKDRRACASREEYVDDLRLTIDERADEIILTAHYPDKSIFDWFGRNVARIDLAVEVPMNMDVSIEDESVSITVEGKGALRIQDGSGSIDVRGVQGTLRVRRDGSGSIDVVEVTGDVVVGRDGSGSIRVEDVSGDFSVGSDGSGGIHYSRVDGTVDIPED
jgi:DUF4097 and DUF4098 domain-containing protein YvlB